jgi:trehalose 6-phosphate synthase/phosphatase
LQPGADIAWKERVRPILEAAADRAPGSFVEEKDLGLAWHYRLADPEIGPRVAGELLALLDRQLAGTDLVAVSGRKVVEVRYGWANKGNAGMALRATVEAPGFELAIGDDRTDEDLFERLPASAWTVHVGRGTTAARFGIPGPDEAIELLAQLAAGWGANQSSVARAHSTRASRPSIPEWRAPIRAASASNRSSASSPRCRAR